MTRLAGLLPLALASACSPNSLQGSLSTLDSLAFTSAAIALGQGDIVVTYEDAHAGGGYDVPFELTVEIGSQPVAKGTVLQLGAQDAAGNPIAVATRSVSGDTRAFPAIKSGTLTLNDSPTVGLTLSGSFFVVFDYQNDSSLGQGQTVEGSFQALVTSSS
jgi:hypothetical protein